MNLKKKLETEYTNSFKDYFEEILRKVALLIETNDFAMAIKLAKKFRQGVTQMGHDPRFTGMTEFRSFVRSKDLKIADMITKIEVKLKDGLGEDAQISIEKFKDLYMSFYRNVDKITFQVYSEAEREKEKGDSKLQKLANKLQSFLKKNLQTFTPEQEQLIQQFRANEKNWSVDEKLEIEKPLSIKDEIRLFTEYAEPLEKQLFEFEKFSWYSSARYYTRIWLDYLEKIANFHEKRPPRVRYNSGPARKNAGLAQTFGN